MHIKTKTKIIAAFAVLIIACNSNDSSSKGDKKEDISAIRNRENDDLIGRGEYLAMVGGCHDCHSPKNFNPHGFTVDSSRLLSGHPANSQLPKVHTTSLQPGNWILMAPDLTAFVGPWGISYAANLTPDSATGIGSWTEEIFVRTLRTGKHLGQETGRPIFPPMPWEIIGKMTDEDLSAIYAYLRSLPPINNRIPDPTPPNVVASKNQ
ncbi:MAG: cytochrome c [Chitinophagaceae bacterium]